MKPRAWESGAGQRARRNYRAAAPKFRSGTGVGAPSCAVDASTRLGSPAESDLGRLRQSTKSLRSGPLRGGVSREGGWQGDRIAIARRGAPS